MTEISNITASANTEINNNSDKKQEIKPNDTSLKNDKVEISSMSKKKKIALGFVAVNLIATAASLAYAIGRNPAKAAKVLKGHSNITNEAYTQGNKLAEEIMNKQGEFKTSFNDILAVFKKPECKTTLHESIKEAEQFFEKHKITPDKETEKALNTIKQKLEQHCNNIEQSLLHGNDIDMYKKGEDFAAENALDLKTISDFLYKQNEVDAIRLSTSFDRFSVPFNLSLREGIAACPKEVLPNNGVFFHGTQKAGKVYKSGFSNFASNQIDKSARELGAGVYVTPDVGVAAYFSGLHGSIIPVKLAPESKVALVTENTHNILFNSVSQFMSERIPAGYEDLPNSVKNATMECLFNRIFKEAGYDAAYIPKGVKGGGLLANIFGGNINEAIGRKQSQLVVFKPENLEITSRSFKERVHDLKDKFSALKAQIKYQQEHPFGF